MTKRVWAAVAWAGLMGFGPQTQAQAAPAEACAEIAIWSNGTHTSLSLEAGLLPMDHPLRAPFPEAEWLLIGWGDAAFYQSDGSDLLLGLRALIPPSPSAIHVLASDRPAEEWFTPKEAPRVALPPGGKAGLAAFLAAAVERGEAGGARVLGPGQVEGRSLFLEGREGFHAFNVCNHWTARALRAAGLDVAGAWSADAITRQLRRLPRCGASPKP